MTALSKSDDHGLWVETRSSTSARFRIRPFLLIQKGLNRTNEIDTVLSANFVFLISAKTVKFALFAGFGGCKESRAENTDKIRRQSGKKFLPRSWNF